MAKAKQVTTDEESSLKRKARRRLIGAVALSVAVVVVLPMVFDGEPPAPTVSDIELRIPDKDKAEEFLASSAVPATSEPVAIVPVEASAPVAASEVTSSPVVAAPIVAAPVVTQVAVAPAPKEEVAKPAKTEAKPKAETKTEAKPAAKPQSGFVVQVGAFANADGAKKLQDKLLKQGLHAYTEKVGHHVRVRVGGFSTRAAADKVRHKLESQGLHPNVVNLGN
jgi:DedD protein